MSFLKNLKANKPTAELSSFFLGCLGKSKIGKTTFAVDLIREHYKGDMSKGLILGTEVGYKTMDGVFAIPITGWDSPEMDDGEQRGFVEVVDELIENREDIPFRFIIIDTITALERYAISHVIKKASREAGKRMQDISDIPWGGGYTMVAEEIYSQIDRLKKNNFGVLVIGHEKTKKITNRDGFEYDYTTFNVLTKTSDIIEREADFLIYCDMQVEKGKNGEPTTVRKLKFRSDGNILCGTRFRNFPSEIEFSSKNFLREFENAVLGLYENDEKAVEVAKQEQQKNAETKLAKVAEKQSLTPQSLHEQIMDIVKNLDSNTKTEVAQYFLDTLGSKDFRQCEDVTLLKQALDYVSPLKK